VLEDQICDNFMKSGPQGYDRANQKPLLRVY